MVCSLADIRVSMLALIRDIYYRVKRYRLRRHMARPRTYTEHMIARFVGGTFVGLQAVLEPGENRADLVRKAVEREIARRRADRKPSPKPDCEK